MLRRTATCHAWMSHVIYEWVMPRMNESCHMWTSHVTHMNKSRHIWMVHVPFVATSCRRVMSHINMSWRQTQANWGWVMPHMNESCHICMSYERATQKHRHRWMGHVTQINESRHISHVPSEFVKSHLKRHELIFCWIVSGLVKQK